MERELVCRLPIQVGKHLVAIAVGFHVPSHPWQLVDVVAAAIESLGQDVVTGDEDGCVTGKRSAWQTGDRTVSRQPGLVQERESALSRASCRDLVRHGNKRQERILVVCSPPPRIDRKSTRLN